MEGILKEEKILRILEEHGVPKEDVEQVFIAKPPLSGDNFGSLVLTVTAKLRNGQVVEMFAKTLVRNPKYAKDIQDMRLFNREAAFFQEILPEIKAFLGKATRGEEKPKFELDILPKCYYGDENLILLENLSPKGYVMLDKFVKHDLRHASAVLDSQAKLHAASYVLLKTGIGGEEMLKKYPTLTNFWSSKEAERMVRPMIQSYVHSAISILEQGLCEDREYGLEFLEKIKLNPLDAMNERAESGRFEDGGKFLCINHGDSWNNNMLFKENASDGVLHTMLIDFQLPNIGSLVLDIGNYLFGSVRADVRANGGLRKCLRIYYERFNEYVEILGGSVDFTVEELEAELKRRYLPGFLMGIATIVALPAFANVKNVDESEGDFAEIFDEGMKKWLRENPGETKNLSLDLVNLFKEHKEMFR